MKTEEVNHNERNRMKDRGYFRTHSGDELYGHGACTSCERPASITSKSHREVVREVYAYNLQK